MNRKNIKNIWNHSTEEPSAVPYSIWCDQFSIESYIQKQTQYYAAISDTWRMTSKVIGFWRIHWCLISSWHFYYLRYMTTTIALTGHWILTKLVLRQDTLILQSLRASYCISDFPKASSYKSSAFLVIVSLLEFVMFQGVLSDTCFEISQQYSIKIFSAWLLHHVFQANQCFTDESYPLSGSIILIFWYYNRNNGESVAL
jgi:hypothetical protein